MVSYSEPSSTSRLPISPSWLPKVFPKLKSSMKTTFSTHDSTSTQTGQVSDVETRPVEQMEIQDNQEPPDGAQVFRTPNARQVIGKMIGANFSIFFAGMNG
jgi:hypothetical protein